jgi:uncharacterized protein
VTKVLIIVLATVAIIWLLKRAFSARKAPDAEAPERQTGAAGGDLVSCAHCGVNLPKAEAYAERGVPPGARGRNYCSEEHWRLGPRKP